MSSVTLPETVRETFFEGLRQRLPLGSRTQDQYQDLDQKPKQETQEPALRAVAFKEKRPDAAKAFPRPDARMLAIARDVITEGPREPTTDYLVDAFISACQHHGISANRTLALAALSASQAERSA